MKKIIGMFHMNNNDSQEFMIDVKKSILALQADDQEVEIQYSTNLEHTQLVYSALILGRK